MKYLVQIMPRPEALDPQGRAVQGALTRLGFKVDDCRVGKAVILEIKEADKNKAMGLINEMAEKILANPLIETYEVRPLS